MLAFQVYNILKDVCPRTMEAFFRRKNLIFLNSLIVTPNSGRVREFGHYGQQRITIVSVCNFLPPTYSFLSLYVFYCFYALIAIKFHVVLLDLYLG